MVIGLIVGILFCRGAVLPAPEQGPIDTPSPKGGRAGAWRSWRFAVPLLLAGVLGAQRVCGPIHPGPGADHRGHAPEGIDCILVLGRGYADGSPTPMLYDRLARGVELYEAGWADVFLLSGDNRGARLQRTGHHGPGGPGPGGPGGGHHPELRGPVHLRQPVPGQGRSSGVESLVIVTQDYHLSRALYLAEALGLEAWGVAAEGRTGLGGSTGNSGRSWPGQGFLLGHLPAGGHHSGEPGR